MRKFLIVVLISALAAFKAATAAEATFDVSYYYYEEKDFMNAESDPAFFSLGVKRWEPTYGAWRLLYTAEITRGFVHYDGSGTLDEDYYKFRGEIYAAYRFHDIAPIIGLGYRWLYDDSGGKTSSTGALAYDRQSQYLYAPLGAIYQFNSDLRLKGQYNFFLYGKQTSYLSDIAGFSDVDNDQRSGWGVDFTADYRLSDSFGIYSFFRYWDIADSDTAVGTFAGVLRFLALEPANTTVEAGIGVAYRF